MVDCNSIFPSTLEIYEALFNPDKTQRGLLSQLLSSSYHTHMQPWFHFVNPFSVPPTFSLFYWGHRVWNNIGINRKTISNTIIIFVNTYQIPNSFVNSRYSYTCFLFFSSIQFSYLHIFFQNSLYVDFQLCLNSQLFGIFFSKQRWFKVS